MCGINGIFAYRDGASPVDESELIRVRDAMAMRGPDGAGVWMSPERRIGLGHRRLSIIDLSESASQPMATPDGRFRISFNGEIYNFRALRRELEGKGYRFRTNSDTEVLLQLYGEHGSAMLPMLRGMFALAIWDALEQTLFLARDPFGIKPLYYADDGGTLRFASQVKALLAGGAVDAARESAGSAGFLLWGCVPEPFTLYRGILALPAGACLTLRRGASPRVAVHFSLRDEMLRVQAESQPFRARDRERLGALLHDSVRHHLVADVPVGVFLSSGVDSTLIASIAAEASSAPLRTLTLGFDEYRGTIRDEAPLAEAAAARLATHHETHWIKRGDFEGVREAILASMDQPSVDGVNTWLVCREAARAGLKVALSGLGGDELFGGYPSFRDVPRLARWLRPAAWWPQAGRVVRRALAPALSVFTSPKYAGLLEYGGCFEGAYLLRRALLMPWELGEVLDCATVNAGLERLQTLPMLAQTIGGLDQDRARVAALEAAWYLRNQLLRDADWASMAHSVELRVPLVDATLFRAVAPWLASRRAPGKRDAAAAMPQPLARERLLRPKTGFSVPVREWRVPRGGEDRRPARGLRDWAREVHGAFGAPVKIARAERVLVFRIGQVGDTVVGVPALWAIRRRFQHAHITLLCDRQPDSRYIVAADLLRGTRLVNEFRTYRGDISGAGGLRRAARMLPLLAWLCLRRFDKLIYLAPSDRSADKVARDRRFFAAAGIREFIGLRGWASSAGYEADLILKRLAADGIPVPPEGEGCMDLELGGNEERAVYKWLDGLPPDGARRWIGVGPGSKMPAKRWPAQRYAEVVDGLIARHDVWPVIFGGLEDRALGETLIAGWGRGYNAAGALGLRAAAAALRRCTFYVGNDTGTMHLAAAAGIPCVAVFSARYPFGRWNPYGIHHTVLQKEIECQGCGLTECLVRRNECLARITPAEVRTGCERMIAAHA